MIIDHKKIRLPVNYLLIKLDNDFDKYHNDKGEETMFIAPTSFYAAENPLSETNYEERDIMDSFSHNFAYSGTVITCPEKLSFLGNEIKEYLASNQHNLGYAEDKDAPHRAKMAALTIMQKVENMRDYSLDKLTPMDVIPGDRVFFDYLEKFKMYDDGRVISTDIGDLVLIKYDKLELRIRDGEIKPLNGNVFVEWERSKPIKFGGLELAGPDKRIEETVGIQEAKVVALPDPVISHFESLDFSDPVLGLSIGDNIAFKSQHASPLENDNHFVLYQGREILKVESKNIIGIWTN